MKKATNEEIQKAIEDFNKIDPQEFLMNAVLHQVSLKDLCKLSDEETETLYSSAYTLYNYGKYQDAINIFTPLTHMNLKETKYWMGLGACHQMLKQYDDALRAYALVIMLDVNNIQAPSHVAECHIAKGDIEQAKVALSYIVDEPLENLSDQDKEVVKRGKSLLEVISTKDNK